MRASARKGSTGLVENEITASFWLFQWRLQALERDWMIVMHAGPVWSNARGVYRMICRIWHSESGERGKWTPWSRREHSRSIRLDLTAGKVCPTITSRIEKEQVSKWFNGCQKSTSQIWLSTDKQSMRQNSPSVFTFYERIRADESLYCPAGREFCRSLRMVLSFSPSEHRSVSCSFRLSHSVTRYRLN